MHLLIIIMVVTGAPARRHTTPALEYIRVLYQLYYEPNHNFSHANSIQHRASGHNTSDTTSGQIHEKSGYYELVPGSTVGRHADPLHCQKISCHWKTTGNPAKANSSTNPCSD